MAAPLIQGSRSSTTISGGSGTLTVTSAVAGEAIVGNIRWYTTATISSVTCTGETVDLLGSPVTGGPSNARSQWFVIRNVASSGTKSIDITGSGTLNAGVEGWRVSGQDTTNTINVQNGASGTSTTPTVSMTTTVAECLGLAIVSNNGADITSPAAGWTVIALADPFWFDDGMEAADLGSAGSKTVDCTASGASSWVINAIAIAPTGAGPSFQPARAINANPGVI